MGAEDTTEVSGVQPDEEHEKRACLVLMQSPDASPGKRYDIGNDPVRIGRGTGNDVNLNDAAVSRRHARIERTGQTLTLRDVGSSSGTWLNGSLLAGTAPLEHDVTIKVGKTFLKYLNVSDMETAFFDEVFKLTTTDHDTQLSNKSFFMRELERESSRAHRHRTRLSLLVIDIDHFKHVNDNYGHEAGDIALRVVADAIKACVRKENVAARYGGEELVVLLGDTAVTDAAIVAERIRRAVETALVTACGHTFHVTVSIGCAEWNPGDEDGTALFQRADDKMYEAKHGGRNRVCI